MFRKLLLAAEARIAVTTTAQKDQNPDEIASKTDSAGIAARVSAASTSKVEASIAASAQKNQD